MLLPLLRQWPQALAVFQSKNLGIIAVSALAGTSSYLCYYKAIAKTGPAKAMALNITYSAWAIPFSLLLLGTLPDVKSVLCGVVIVLGALAAAMDRRKSGETAN